MRLPVPSVARTKSRSRTVLLYACIVMIWGSTWLAIKFQLGRVDPLVSVFYRFAAASALSLAACLVLRLPLRFSGRDHVWIALQGFLIFSVGYWMIYEAERFIASGLAAVVSSCLIFMNILNGWWLLRKPFRRHVTAGAAMGIAGISMIFLPELRALDWSDAAFKGLVLCVGSTVLTSLGNIVSERSGRAKLPVFQTNALSMGYGALLLFLLALVTRRRFDFDASASYAASLAYLAVFGSVVAFWCYMTLIHDIGADRAAYGPLVVPVIALFLSSAFEGYAWTAASVAGIVLIGAGNLAVMGRGVRSRRGVPPEAP
jgi:drug/metabolite transporter (DMT)-like permease